MADAPPDARAVTLHPHWAHAVAWLGKRIENRNRPIPPALVGQRVAIHAGATLPAGWADDMLLTAPVGRTDSACFSIGYRLPRVSDGNVSRVAYSVEEDGVTEHVVVTRAIVATAVLRPHEPSAKDWQFAGRGHLIAEWRTTLPAWRPGGGRPRTARAAPPPWPPGRAEAHAAHWWALHDVITLVQPVGVKRGQLGLWRLDAATVDAVGAAGGWG